MLSPTTSTTHSPSSLNKPYWLPHQGLLSFSCTQPFNLVQFRHQFQSMCLIFLHISFLGAFTKCPINLTWFWYYLPGLDIRFHRLSWVQSYKSTSTSGVHLKWGFISVPLAAYKWKIPITLLLGWFICKKGTQNSGNQFTHQIIEFLQRMLKLIARWRHP